MILETNHGNTPSVLDGVMMLEPQQQAYVAETYNVQTYFPPDSRLLQCGRDPLDPCLNPDLDTGSIQQTYVRPPLVPTVRPIVARP